MSPKARDLGEPLEIALLGKAEIPIVRDKRECTMLKEDLQIVVDRANALEGCPDPEAFVESVRRWTKILGTKGFEDSPLDWLWKAPK